MSRKTQKGFGLCTHPDVHGFRGLKVTCINFHMFLGMVKKTSKDKKWSKGSKESAEGKGKAIQVCFFWRQTFDNDGILWMAWRQSYLLSVSRVSWIDESFLVYLFFV